MTLLELAERCENATGGARAQAQSQRALLEEAWAAIHGSPPRRNRGGDNPENLFVSMLDARAYESAAMTLVPGGGPFILTNADLDTIGDYSRWRVSLEEGGDFPIACSTPALALCAAALRTRSTQEGDKG